VAKSAQLLDRFICRALHRMLFDPSRLMHMVRHRGICLHVCLGLVVSIVIAGFQTSIVGSVIENPWLSGFDDMHDAVI